MNLTNFAKYHVWAGDKFRTNIKSLSDKEFYEELEEYFSYKSVYDLVKHMISAQEFCLAMINNSSPEEFNKLWEKIASFKKDELITFWEESDLRLSKLFQENLDEKISIPWRNTYTLELDKQDFILQYPLHSTYHRGQLTLALKKLNRKIVGTDYLHYFLAKENIEY